MSKKFNTVQEIAADFWMTNDIKLYLAPKDKREEYDREPVHWCTVCKSLKIIRCTSPLDSDLECYCADCGGIDTTQGSIYTWEAIQKEITNLKE